jgi:hypothetical protein
MTNASALTDRLFTLLKIVVSVGLILFLFRRVPVTEVRQVVARANLWLILLAQAMYFLAISTGTFKWWVLLRAQDIHVPYPDLLGIMFVGLFFGNFLPTNVGGDVVRGFDLARYTSRAAEAAISVVVDRVVGLIAFMSMAVASALVVTYAAGQVSLQGVATAAITGLAVLVGTFALMLSRRLRKRVEKIFEWSLLAPFAPVYGRLSSALTAYRHSVTSLLAAYCISVTVLLISNFVNFTIAEALGGGIPLLYIFLFNPLIAFVLLVPISVGGLGINQSAYVFFYGLVGIAAKIVFPVSLVMQSVIYVASLPGGLLWLRKRRQSAEILPAGESPVGPTAT